MFKVGAAVAAGGFALTMALQSAQLAEAAPLQHSTLAKPAAHVTAAAQGQAAYAPVSRGHLFGKFISTTARAFPAGPQHGKVISAFARSANPGHTKAGAPRGHSGKTKR